jgi:hypothetical protein
MAAKNRVKLCREDNVKRNCWFVHITVLLLVLLAFSSEWLPAQSTSPQTAEKKTSTVAEFTPTNEEALASVREQLFKLLRMSPRLTSALTVDPTLLGYQEYVNRNNPELARFLLAHPEIVRNPEFYLFANLRGAGNRDFLFQRAVWPEIGSGRPSIVEDALIPFLVFLIVLSAILWLLRVYLQNRRWGRVFKVQTDIHTKLLEKFGGSQELLTYMGTEAGRKFLELAPIKAAIESSPEGLLSPTTRIVAPLQLGIVATLVGIGLLYIKSYFNDSGALLLIGTIGLMLGIGFILSAAIAWLLAQRLGLVGKTKPGTVNPQPLS